jgi:hypothetical protein
MEVRKLFVNKIRLFLISILLSGCIQPIDLGRLNFNNGVAVKEFYVNNIKVLLKVENIIENSVYNYQLSMNDKDALTRIKNVKLVIEIKKYNKYPPKRHWEQYEPKSNIERFEIDSNDKTVTDSFRFTFDSKGKYKILINIIEINGIQVTSDNIISFEQAIR